MELPIYQITLKDEEHGVDKISLVTAPAIEENWLAFNEAETNFKFANEEEQKLIGALLVPDKKIYRNDPELGEFYVVFSAETIEEISLRYNKNGYATKFNTEHTTDVSDVVLTENWIVTDTNYDKSKAYGLDYPVGSWVGLAKIESEELWNEVKANLKGFSVELLSSLSYSEFKDEAEVVEEEEEKPTDKQMLEWLGEKGEDLDFYEQSDEWIVEEEEEIELDSDFAITSKPNKDSKYDNENYRIRYRYTGGAPKENTREFCREMMTTYKRKIFRYEDINQMSFRRENSEFGTYSIWKWKGRYNCRHRWVKIPIKLTKAKSNVKPPNPPNWYEAKRLNKNIPKSRFNNQININNPMEFKIKFEAMAVLADGSTVYTPTEWVAGALVYAGENEEASLASAGEYTLESGEVLVVGEGGVVEELRPVAEESAEEDLATEEAQNYATEIANLTSRVEELEAKLNDVNGEESKTEDFSKQIDEAVKVALSKVDGSKFATEVTDEELEVSESKNQFQSYLNKITKK